MTEISLPDVKKTEEKAKALPEKPNDVNLEDGAVNEAKSAEDKELGVAGGIFAFIFLFLAIFFIDSYVLPVLCPSPPYQPRFVTLNKTDGDYGLVVGWGEIAEVVPGGPADLSGQVKRGDKIAGVNGISMGSHGSYWAPDQIQALMEKREDDVKLVLVENYQVSLKPSLCRSLLATVIIACLYLIVTEAVVKPAPERLVWLTKANGSYGFFYVEKTITSIVPGGPADLQDLKVGDVIVSINGVNVHGRHAPIDVLLATRDSDAKLVVRSKTQ